VGKKVKQTAKKEDKISIVLLIPIMLILAIIPLIVYMRVVPNDEATKIFMGGLDNNVDFFSYYKSLWFIVLTGIGLFIFLSQVLLDKNIKIRKDPIYYPMMAYAILIIISTIFATYKTVALRGFMDRYEGMWVLLSYLVVMFLAYNLINNEKQLKYILGSLGFSTIIISIIGFTQYIGKDIYKSNFMRKLITPSAYNDQIDKINFNFEANRVYASLYNPNYVGVYSTMIFSLFLTIFLLTKSKMLKTASGFISILSLLSLFGSGSRAGLLTLGLYFILLAIIFRKVIIRRWKASLIILVTVLLLFVGANIYSNNNLFSRLTSGINSIIIKEEPYNFKNIYTENNSLIIVYDDYSLKIQVENGNIEFYGDNNNLLAVEQTGLNFKIIDPPYNKHSFAIVSVNDTYGLHINLETNRKNISFYTEFLKEDGLGLLNNMNQLVTPYKAPSIGFEGREAMASNRGYIWSRSLPMLSDVVLVGNGPDTYGLHFPNNDYYGKLIGLSINQQVDKPHSLYFQIALNTGLLSLIIFLILLLNYLYLSFKIFINMNIYDSMFKITGLGIFFLVVLYLIMGISNDSIVSISPLFWILLGVGFKINKVLDDNNIIN